MNEWVRCAIMKRRSVDVGKYLDVTASSLYATSRRVWHRRNPNPPVAIHRERLNAQEVVMGSAVLD